MTVYNRRGLVQKILYEGISGTPASLLEQRDPPRIKISHGEDFITCWEDNELLLMNIGVSPEQ